MSIDYEAVCFKCKKIKHIGQTMACIPSFGYGSNDQEGANAAAAWVMDHIDNCGLVVVMNSNDVPDWPEEDI
jgi:hypothetical protein